MKVVDVAILQFSIILKNKEGEKILFREEKNAYYFFTHHTTPTTKPVRTKAYKSVQMKHIRIEYGFLFKIFNLNLKRTDVAV
jgi:hypothetical protein